MGMKRIAQSNLGTGTGTLLYTVPSGYKCDVNDVVVANTTSAAITVKLHFVPVGVSVGATNLLFPDVNIPANTMIQWCGTQALNAGDFIQGIGSATGVTVTITGDEYRAIV